MSWAPIHKRDWDQWAGYPEVPTPEEAIRASCNFLISQLYQPDEEHGAVVDQHRVRELVGEAPGSVNWGSLECYEVEKRGPVYVARVSEADQYAYGLRRYLEKWLQAWGWPVVVETEW